MTMILEKLRKPLAVCSVCRKLTKERKDLNNRCRGSFNGRRCYGTMKSGVSSLWDECESCHAAGRVGSQICRECAGFGWHPYG